MRTFVIISLLVVSATGCSGMGAMSSGSSGMSHFSGSTGGYGMEDRNNWNSMHNSVINPRTGQLNLYHGG